MVLFSLEVQFAGGGGTMRGNGEFLDVWNGVLVSSSDIVECMVISFKCCKLPIG